MTRELNDISTKDRSEMVCPGCHTQGLVELEERAVHFEDDREKLLSATGCSNEECEYYAGAGDNAIPSDAIEAQTPDPFSVDEIFKKVGGDIDARTTIFAACGVLVFGALIVALIGLPGGSSGVASADGSPDLANVSEQPGNMTVYLEAGNWTIYEYKGQYVVSGAVDGETVYLHPEGVVEGAPYFFNTTEAARQAILAWRANADQGNAVRPDSRTRTPACGQFNSSTPWRQYEHNDSHIVATQTPSRVVFLDSSGEVQLEPYTFVDTERAERAILAWQSRDDRDCGDFQTPSESAIEEEIAPYFQNGPGRNSNNDSDGVNPWDDYGDWPDYSPDDDYSGGEENTDNSGSGETADNGGSGGPNSSPESGTEQSPPTDSTGTPEQSNPNNSPDSPTETRDEPWWNQPPEQGNEDTPSDQPGDQPGDSPSDQPGDSPSDQPSDSPGDQPGSGTPPNELTPPADSPPENPSSPTPIEGTPPDDPVNTITETTTPDPSEQVPEPPEISTPTPMPAPEIPDQPGPDTPTQPTEPTPVNPGDGDDPWQPPEDGGNTGGGDNTGAVDTTLSGVVDRSDTLQPVTSATVKISPSGSNNVITANTNSDGQYSFSEITPGEATLWVEPPEESGVAVSPPITIDVTSNGDVAVTNPREADINYATNNQGTIANNDLAIRLPVAQSISGSGEGKAIEGTIDLLQPQNADDVTVTLSPVNRDTTATRIINSSESERVTINGDRIISQQVGLVGNTSYKVINETGTISVDDGLTTSVRGNIAPYGSRFRVTPFTRIDTHGFWSKSGNYDIGISNPTLLPSRNGAYIAYESNGDYPLEVPIECYDSCDGASGRITGWTLDTWYSSSKASATGDISLTASAENIDADTATVTAEIVHDRPSRSYILSPEPTHFDSKSAAQDALETWRANTDISHRSMSVEQSGSQYVVQDEFKPAYIDKGHTWRSDRVVNKDTTSDAITATVYLKKESISATTEVVESYSVTATGSSTEEKTVTVDETIDIARGSTVSVRVNITGHGAVDPGITLEEEVLTKIRGTVGDEDFAVGPDPSDDTGVINGNWQGSAGHVVPGRGSLEVDHTSPGGIGQWILYSFIRQSQNISISAGGTQTCFAPGTNDWFLEYDAEDGNFDRVTTRCDIPAEQLTEGEGKITGSVDNYPANYTHSYVARATPEEATVTINGQELSYPGAFDVDGPLPVSFDFPVEKNISLLDTGENTVSLDTAKIDGIDTGGWVLLNYTVAQAGTRDPTITVVNGAGESHSKTAPNAVIDDGKLTEPVEVSLPADWFTSGPNVIRISGADGTYVKATVNATVIQRQAIGFTEADE